MRPWLVPDGSIGISCTQAQGRSVAALVSWQVSRVFMPGMGEESGSRWNENQVSVRVHGLGVRASDRMGWMLPTANWATPVVPALDSFRKFAPTKSTYQGQVPPCYVSVAERVPT